MSIIELPTIGFSFINNYEFREQLLKNCGVSQTVLVVATSDEAPIMRKTAPYTATAIAEHFRSQGLNVLLLVDSLTRTARAIREVSLEAGELPVRQGYTNSVYRELPKLLERAGNDDKGSMTAIYAVLTTEEEEDDPLAQEITRIAKYSGQVAWSAPPPLNQSAAA